MKETKTNRSKKTNLRTAEMILDRACEIINTEGMSEFRIEALALSLGLSCGNVTYYFSKKEEIGQAIMEHLYEDLSCVDHFMTPIMDISQAFLSIRTMCSTIYSYRGVIMYYGSIHCETDEPDIVGEKLRAAARNIMTYLHNRGYLKWDAKSKRLFENIFFINLRFWVNREYLIAAADAHATVKSRIAAGSSEVLYSLRPLFTPAALAEYQKLHNQLKLF